MGIKDLVRRYSAAKLTGSRHRKREDARKSSHHRGLRLEQFEDRLLLSITTPPSLDLVAVLTSNATYKTTFYLDNLVLAPVAPGDRSR